MSSSVGDPVAFVETRFGIRLKRVGREEYAGPCPWCGGEDRFHVWLRSNYWCRPGPGHCGRAGWLDELDGGDKPTKEQVTEWRLAALERGQVEHERRLSALEAMHQCQDHLAYHQNLDANAQAVEYWLSEGMAPRTIADRLLGYCPNCPTAPGCDSYTIPVMFRGELYNIRHRLVNGGSLGKYRPHRSGLPAMLFNADDLLEPAPVALILEGEKKSLVVSQETGIPNVAIMGAQAFKEEWVPKFAKFPTVYVAFDPDARTRAVATARLFEGRARVVELPAKADDLFVKYGMRAQDFQYYLQLGRPVGPRGRTR